MCMTAGVASRGGVGSFICTDERILFVDGSHKDPGGKVVSTGSGWATGAGPVYEPWRVSMSALREAGPMPMVHIEGKAYPAGDFIDRARGIVFGALAANGLGECPENHILLIEPRSGVISLQAGIVEEHEIVGVWPLGLEGLEQTSRFEAMRQSVRGAGEELFARIRAVAHHFASASRAVKTMSDTMEIGYILGPVHGFLRGRAEEIAHTEPCEIPERFHAKPRERLPLDLEIAMLATKNTVATGDINDAAVTKAKVEARNRCELTNGIGTNPTVVTGTATYLPWDTETFDVGTLHDLATNTSRITIPTGGDSGAWLFTAQVKWDTNATSYREISIRKNRTGAVLRWVRNDASANGLVHQVVGWDSSPVVGDYYEVEVVQTSGADRLVSGNGSFFSALHLW